MTSIEFFLNKQIYSSESHPRGWDKYVYDDENIISARQLTRKERKQYEQQYI